MIDPLQYVLFSFSSHTLLFFFVTDLEAEKHRDGDKVNNYIL